MAVHSYGVSISSDATIAESVLVERSSLQCERAVFDPGIPIWQFNSGETSFLLVVEVNEEEVE